LSRSDNSFDTPEEADAQIGDPRASARSRRWERNLIHPTILQRFLLAKDTGRVPFRDGGRGTDPLSGGCHACSFFFFASTREAKKTDRRLASGGKSIRTEETSLNTRVLASCDDVDRRL
jgi:hypothetical protein